VEARPPPGTNSHRALVGLVHWQDRGERELWDLACAKSHSVNLVAGLESFHAQGMT
jgi:hypothetical protein